MLPDLPYYVQRVPTNGFHWLDATTADLDKPRLKGRFLTAGIPVKMPIQVRAYDPLQERGLFRTFADLQPSEPTILDFANRYGLLGFKMRMIPVAPGPKPGSHLVGAGELLNDWKAAVTEMQESVSIWDSVQQRDASRLQQLFSWIPEDQGVRYHQASPDLPKAVGGEWLITQNEPELFSRFAPGDLFGPALLFIQRRINTKLVEYSVTARLLWNPGYSRLSLHFVPSSLLGCLWLQFAQALDGDRKYRQCPDCRRWFEFTSHASRKDKVFCSPTCKASAHRKKIGRALNR